jgi:hypothetical protein
MQLQNALRRSQREGSASKPATQANVRFGSTRATGDFQCGIRSLGFRRESRSATLEIRFCLLDHAHIRTLSAVATTVANACSQE